MKKIEKNSKKKEKIRKNRKGGKYVRIKLT